MAGRSAVGLLSVSDHHNAWSWRPDVLLTVTFENQSLPLSPILRCPGGVVHALHASTPAFGPSLLWNASDPAPSALAQRMLAASSMLHAEASSDSPPQELVLLLRSRQLANARACQLGNASGAGPLQRRRTRAPGAASPFRVVRLARLLVGQLGSFLPRPHARTGHSACRMPLQQRGRLFHTSFLHVDGGGSVRGRREVGSSEGTQLRSGARQGVALMQQLSVRMSTTACATRMRTDIADSLAVTVQTTLESQFVMTLIKAIAIPLLLLLCIPFVIALLDAMMPYLSPKLGPGMIASAEPVLVMFLYPKIYGNVGLNMITLLSGAINARAGGMLCRSLAFHLPRILTASIPPKLTEYMMKAWAPEVAKSLLYNVLHALTHSLTHSISHHLTQAVTQGVTHSITHALVHYYYCIYCYKSGDFCRYCYYYNDWLRLAKQTGSGRRYGRMEERVH